MYPRMRLPGRRNCCASRTAGSANSFRGSSRVVPPEDRAHFNEEVRRSNRNERGLRHKCAPDTAGRIGAHGQARGTMCADGVGRSRADVWHCSPISLTGKKRRPRCAISEERFRATFEKAPIRDLRIRTDGAFDAVTRVCARCSAIRRTKLFGLGATRLDASRRCRATFACG